MERSVVRLGANGLINSRVCLVRSVLRGVDVDKSAERIEVRTVDGQRMIVESDRLVGFIFRQRYGRQIDVNLSAVWRGVMRRQEILPSRFDVAQLQSRRAVCNQG